MAKSASAAASAEPHPTVLHSVTDLPDYNPATVDYAIVKHRDVGPMAVAGWSACGEVHDATGIPGSTMVVVQRPKGAQK